jgi:hypothetical protein
VFSGLAFVSISSSWGELGVATTYPILGFCHHSTPQDVFMLIYLGHIVRKYNFIGIKLYFYCINNNINLKTINLEIEQKKS